MRPRFLGRVLTVMLAAAAMASCGPLTHDKEVAADAMDQFHDRFNAGQYDKIYDTADADLQSGTPRAEFLAFLDKVRRQLGDYRTCASQGWATNIVNSNTSLTLHYKTTFTKGVGDEEFVYHVSGTRATLRGYHVDSNSLAPE